MHSMGKKFIILITLVMFGITGGAVIIASSSKAETKAVLSKTSGVKISIDHKEKRVGDISYSKGILYHVFPVKNIGTKNLEIANMFSSCMCTKTYLKIAGKDGPNFGMRGTSAPSSWVGVLKPGESGEIIAAFNPAYHGPSGLGEVTRTVSFETNDPDQSYIELSFEGVVKK